MIGNEFKVQCLKTGVVSKKTWKTYDGASKNVKTPTEWVITPKGLDWCRRHPEASKEITDKRLNNL